jgi:hypothetical protein
MLKVTTDMDGVAKKVNKICKNDEVGYFMATEFKRLMSPYTPRVRGTLEDTAQIEPFKITYVQPYAKYIYYGDGFNFSTDKHPNATSRWDVVTKNSKGKQFANSISRFIKKR